MKLLSVSEKSATPALAQSTGDFGVAK